jgi:hypothetical protein
MAVAAAGPMPGSTPIIVPSTQPVNANSKLAGVKQVSKPPNKS